MNWWEWVFSGIGVSGLLFLLKWLRRRPRSSGPLAAIPAQGAKVSDSPVASGSGIIQTVNSPTVNLSLPTSAPSAPGEKRYNEWLELRDELHESFRIMANAFAYRPPAGIIDVDEREDYHDGIHRGYRVLRNRILIADVLKSAGMLEKFESIVEYAVSADTPRDPSQRGCPTRTGFAIKASKFEDELIELARKDSESGVENAGIQLEEHKRRFLVLEELAGQLVEELASYRPLSRSMIEPMMEQYRRAAGRFARHDNVRRAILQLQNSLDRMYVAKRDHNDDQEIFVPNWTAI